ncbi:MAG: hypothetical protein Q9174_005161 [Haloplaca sp. 1 TL-2023]
MPRKKGRSRIEPYEFGEGYVEVPEPKPTDYPDDVFFPLTLKLAREYLLKKWYRPTVWSAFALLDHGDHRYERMSYHTLYKAYKMLKMSHCQTFEKFVEFHIKPYYRKDRVVFSPPDIGWWGYVDELTNVRKHQHRDEEERSIVREWKAGGRTAEKKTRKSFSFRAWAETRENFFIDKLEYEGKHYLHEPIMEDDEWRISEHLPVLERNAFAQKWNFYYRREKDHRAWFQTVVGHKRNNATSKEAHNEHSLDTWGDNEDTKEYHSPLRALYIDGTRQKDAMDRRNREEVKRIRQSPYQTMLRWRTAAENGNPGEFSILERPKKTGMSAEDYKRVSAILAKAREEHELHKNDEGYQTPCFRNIGEIFLNNEPPTFYVNDPPEIHQGRLLGRKARKVFVYTKPPPYVKRDQTVPGNYQPESMEGIEYSEAQTVQPQAVESKVKPVTVQMEQSDENGAAPQQLDRHTPRKRQPNADVIAADRPSITHSNQPAVTNPEEEIESMQGIEYREAQPVQTQSIKSKGNTATGKTVKSDEIGAALQQLGLHTSRKKKQNSDTVAADKRSTTLSNQPAVTNPKQYTQSSESQGSGPSALPSISKVNESDFTAAEAALQQGSKLRTSPNKNPNPKGLLANTTQAKERAGTGSDPLASRAEIEDLISDTSALSSLADFGDEDEDGAEKYEITPKRKRKRKTPDEDGDDDEDDEPAAKRMGKWRHNTRKVFGGEGA